MIEARGSVLPPPCLIPQRPFRGHSAKNAAISRGRARGLRKLDCSESVKMTQNDETLLSELSLPHAVRRRMGSTPEWLSSLFQCITHHIRTDRDPEDPLVPRTPREGAGCSSSRTASSGSSRQNPCLSLPGAVTFLPSHPELKHPDVLNRRMEPPAVCRILCSQGIVGAHDQESDSDPDSWCKATLTPAALWTLVGSPHGPGGIRRSWDSQRI